MKEEKITLEHWKDICKAVFIAENTIHDSLKEMKESMEKDGKSVEEIADKYLEMVATEILSKQ